MICFLKNNFYRIISRGHNVATALLMSIGAIALAVYFTSSLQVKGSIAVVTQSTDTFFQSDYIVFTTVEKEPLKYQLVLGKYDGVIIDRGNGRYDVDTIKNDDYRKMLQEIAKNPTGFVPKADDVRGIGANIIGYLIVFILLQSFQFMFTLAEDMQLKQIERIAKSPVSFAKYVLAHFVSTFALTFTPAFLVLMIMKGIFGYNVGFSLLQYVILLGLLCSFGTAFAMFLNSIVKSADAANMTGSASVVLTTILSGSFYSFEKGNEILEKAIGILPQKAYLSFVMGLENGKAVIEMLPQIVYIVVISLVFFTFSILKIKKDYVLKVD